MSSFSYSVRALFCCFLEFSSLNLSLNNVPVIASFDFTLNSLPCGQRWGLLVRQASWTVWDGRPPHEANLTGLGGRVRVQTRAANVELRVEPNRNWFFWRGNLKLLSEEDENKKRAGLFGEPDVGGCRLACAVGPGGTELTSEFVSAKIRKSSPFSAQTWGRPHCHYWLSGGALDWRNGSPKLARRNRTE